MSSLRPPELTLGALGAVDDRLTDVVKQDAPGLAGAGPAPALRAGEVEGDGLGRPPPATSIAEGRSRRCRLRGEGRDAFADDRGPAKSAERRVAVENRLKVWLDGDGAVRPAPGLRDLLRAPAVSPLLLAAQRPRPLEPPVRQSWSAAARPGGSRLPGRPSVSNAAPVTSVPPTTAMRGAAVRARRRGSSPRRRGFPPQAPTPRPAPARSLATSA